MTARTLTRASERKPGFFGWKVVGGAVVLQALVAALFQQAYGVYATFWMSEFGWSSTTISLAYSLHRTESALLGPLHGWLLQRFSPRSVVLAGIVLLGGGFVWLGFVPGLAQFIGAFLLMAVGASLAGWLSLTTVLVNWFERYRALVHSLMATGLSIGGLAIPLVTLVMVAYGWRAAAIGSGVLVLLVGIPASRLMFRQPEDLGLLPDGGPGPDVSGDHEERVPLASMSLGTALRSKEFWLLSFGHTMGVTIVSSISVHFVVFAREQLSLTVTLAAAIFTVMVATSMLGQLVGGYFGDRFDKRYLAAWGMVGHASAIVILAFASSSAALVLAAVLHGLGWGVRGPLMGTMRADYFGRGSYAVIMGVVSLIVTLGSVGGPLLAGILADATGGYRGAFLILGGMAVAGAGAFVVLRAPAT